MIAALLGGGVWAIIGQSASFGDLGRAVSGAGPWWFVLSLSGAPVGYLGYALVYQALARVADGPRPPLSLVVRLTIAVFGASVVATSAGRLGSEYWSLRRMKEDPVSAWSRVLAINVAAWAVLGTLAAIAGLAGLAGLGRGPHWLELAWAATVAGCVVLALAVSSPRWRGLAEDRGGRLRRLLASAVRALVLIRLSVRTTPVGWRVAVGALLYWGGELLTVWSALFALGVRIGPVPLILGYATGYMSTMVPLPAGGAGGVDAASTYALTWVGVPLGPALLATLVQRICTFWLPLAVAIVRVRSLRRLPVQLPGVENPGQEAANDRTGAGDCVTARTSDAGSASRPTRGEAWSPDVRPTVGPDTARDVPTTGRCPGDARADVAGAARDSRETVGRARAEG